MTKYISLTIFVITLFVRMTIFYGVVHDHHLILSTVWEVLVFVGDEDFKIFPRVLTLVTAISGGVFLNTIMPILRFRRRQGG